MLVCHIPSNVDVISLTKLGERIRERRLALGWTQEDLAYHAGIDRSYIAGVERGKRNLSFSLLCQICRALKCHIAALTYDLPDIPDV